MSVYFNLIQCIDIPLTKKKYFRVHGSGISAFRQHVSAIARNPARRLTPNPVVLFRSPGNSFHLKCKMHL